MLREVSWSNALAVRLARSIVFVEQVKRNPDCPIWQQAGAMARVKA
jgi:hypothetical protein